MLREVQRVRNKRRRLERAERPDSALANPRVAVFQLLRNRLRVKGERDGRDLRKDVERLTERVRVLETLATDEDKRLRDEIRRLA